MFLTRAQVREVDRRAIEEFGVPGVVLMENAGRGAAEILLSLQPAGPVVLCCGKGNNGGDGFVIARHLDNRGLPLRIFLFAQPKELTGDAAVMFQIVQRSGLSIVYQPEVAELAGAGWIVDALFGTGLTGAVRPPFDKIIEAINASGRPVFAVDLPSGLDCDTGLSLGATIRAAHTATFVAPKVGFANPAAKEWLGEVHVVDIGAPRVLVAPLLATSKG